VYSVILLWLKGMALIVLLFMFLGLLIFKPRNPFVKGGGFLENLPFFWDITFGNMWNGLRVGALAAIVCTAIAACVGILLLP
jgi:ABC-type spermidine/putrescine transport system permease subunit I